MSVQRNLVTGGAGFIGSHLIDRLMSAGEEVICLDNLYTGARENLSRWLDHPRFTWMERDVTEPISAEVGRVWHLACPASPVHYQRDPIQTCMTSFMGTYQVLALARDTGARVLFASTSEVYGDPEVHPQPESYLGHVNPIGPRACYDEGKRVAETLCFDFHRAHGVAVRVARIFNTYGPRMRTDDGRVVSNFITQALRGEALTLFGDGSQTRSFCYVEDLVEGLLRLMESEHTGPINLGNPQEVTVRELAELTQRLVGGPAQLSFMPLPTDDPTRRKPSIERARAELNWGPTKGLEEGLTLTINEMRARR